MVKTSEKQVRALDALHPSAYKQIQAASSLAALQKHSKRTTVRSELLAAANEAGMVLKQHLEE